MSLFDYLFDSDLMQRSDIEDLKRQTATLSSRSTRNTENRDRITELENDMCDLALTCKTLMRVLVENKLCTPQQLEELMRVVDGKVSAGEKRGKSMCPECRRDIRGERKTCMYCGVAFPWMNDSTAEPDE